MSSELRLYAIINMEALKLAGGNRGKMMAQAGHAFLHAWWDADARFPDAAKAYRFGQAALKIVLKGDNAAQLEDWYAQARPLCGATLVTDAARTVFPEPTVTFLGLGPIAKDEAPDWLQSLRPLI